ncbi:unnamed protein product [Mycena citricolor]|uniref:Uncharacterized protein n=1 Tax=Mycena citricolor TaxID=2018698 RepID=A0AAD2JVE9_9AGAR|nr:unnamed protein product [Mycena citricolor]
MTEYDFSPEAMERYQATQNRIQRWTQDTSSTNQADPYAPAIPAPQRGAQVFSAASVPMSTGTQEAWACKKQSAIEKLSGVQSSSAAAAAAAAGNEIYSYSRQSGPHGSHLTIHTQTSNGTYVQRRTYQQTTTRAAAPTGPGFSTPPPLPLYGAGSDRSRAPSNQSAYDLAATAQGSQRTRAYSTVGTIQPANIGIYAAAPCAAAHPAYQRDPGHQPRASQKSRSKSSVALSAQYHAAAQQAAPPVPTVPASFYANARAAKSSATLYAAAEPRKSKSKSTSKRAHRERHPIPPQFGLHGEYHYVTSSHISIQPVPESHSTAGQVLAHQPKQSLFKRMFHGKKGKQDTLPRSFIA